MMELMESLEYVRANIDDVYASLEAVLKTT